MQPSQTEPPQNPPQNQLPLQFKPKKPTGRSSGLFHNKSVLLTRSPLANIGSNSSFCIESPHKDRPSSRPTSPSSLQATSAKPKQRFRSTFEPVIDLQKLQQGLQGSDYHARSKFTTFSPQKGGEGNSQGPKLKKKLTFDLTGPAFLVEEDEQGRVKEVSGGETLNVDIPTLDYSQTQQQQTIQPSFAKRGSPQKSAFSKSRIFDKHDSIGQSDCFSSQPQQTSRGISLSDFQKGKFLGKGHFGQVFLAQHIKTGMICAMKTITKQKIHEQKVQQQMVRQLKIHGFLRHTNIIEQYGFFADQENLYILLELCPEGQLYNLLKRKKRLTEQTAAIIIRQVCEGLLYMHGQRIIHRDIKPENIILTNGIVKLCDFGWAVNCAEGLRQTRCGTPLYLSPEMIQGQMYDQSVDIWAVGVLTYQLIVGKLPFKIYWQGQLNRIVDDQVTFPSWVEVSDTARNFILTVLQKNPKQRVQVQDLLHHPFLKTAQPNQAYYQQLQ